MPASGVLFVKTTEPGEHRSRVGKPDRSSANPRASEVDAELTRVGDTNAEFMDGLPLLKPPYGHLVAIDLNRGAIKWRVPFGDTPSLRRHPALKDVTLPAVARRRPARRACWRPRAGSCSRGGGDLAFHAVDAATGAELWHAAAAATRERHADDLSLAQPDGSSSSIATGGGEDAVAGGVCVGPLAGKP